MADLSRRALLVCSCEGTMAPDTGAIAKACGARAESAHQLCGAELHRFREIAASAEGLVVGCTQERPLFEDVLAEAGLSLPVAFANIRETAGWSSEGARAGPKMAALLAAATVAVEPTKTVTLESDGVVLIYGSGTVALDAAEALKDRLDITVLLTSAEGAVPPRVAEFPVRLGRIRRAQGQLGAFTITVDGYAEPAPSSRAAYRFGPARDGLVSHADILIDLSGGTPLVSAPDLRAGYVRADPASPLDVQKALFRAADLIGTFDKPRYIDFDAALCAHARSRKIGCTRCLDLCPTGAIAPDGDHVAIDAGICAGCGACAAICPTGAATYALPPPDTLISRLRILLSTYRAAGGVDAILLFHDAGDGAALIDAAARFGEGLPANVLPVEVNESGQLGLEAIAAAFAYGAAGTWCLTRASPRHAIDGLTRTIALADDVLSGLGYGRGAVSLLQTDDPDALVAALRQPSPGRPTDRPATFAAAGPKRQLLSLTLSELHRAAPTPVDQLTLPAGAPFGGLRIEVEGCTLCLACVGACPTGALSDDPDRPVLRFKEDACVQCGLCAATCPEKVITLEPRLDFTAFNAAPKLVKEEAPFHCIACGTPFGVKSTVERIVAKLEGKHWMFAGDMKKRIDVVRMCERCRVEAVTNEGFDPYGAPPRPPTRTSADYLEERAEQRNEGKDDG